MAPSTDPTRWRAEGLGAAGLAAALLLSACTSSGDPTADPPAADLDGLPAADVTVLPGTREVTITGTDLYAEFVAWQPDGSFEEAYRIDLVDGEGWIAGKSG